MVTNFHIDLVLVRDDQDDGTEPDRTITLATVFSESTADELFEFFAQKLGTEV